MLRTLPGLGTADYTHEEEELVRRLIDQDAHREVVILHQLKVELDARPDHRDSCWAVLREQANAREAVEQLEIT